MRASLNITYNVFTSNGYWDEYTLAIMAFDLIHLSSDFGPTVLYEQWFFFFNVSYSLFRKPILIFKTGFFCIISSH